MDSTETGSLPEDNFKKAKFNIDLSSIQSIQKEDQDAELQSLVGLSVFDQSALEKGVIQQFSKALTGNSETFLEVDGCGELEKEDGEIDEVQGVLNEEESLANEQHLRDSNSVPDPISKIEEYLKTQLKLQERRKLEAEKKEKKLTVTSIFKKKKKYDISARKLEKEVKAETPAKKEKKAKYLGPSKKRKREKLGTKKGNKKTKSLPNLQPGEENYFYNNTSGSEYVPSEEDSDSSQGFELKAVQRGSRKAAPKTRRSKLDYIFCDRVDTDDSDWETEQALSKKKGSKELDDGDLELFCHRLKECQESGRTMEKHVIEGDLSMPADIWDKLYEYQRRAVVWLWGLNKQLSGGILGDEMGLGKTIQLVAFLAALHSSSIQDQFTRYKGLGPTLIVCPTTVMHQWVREFHKWYPEVRVAILHESGTYTGKDRKKLVHSITTESTRGILITSYNGLVQYQDTIVPKDWHYVVLDEGHKIRNNKAKVTETAKQLETPHRIILSGSPLQNNLQELWCLFDFVCPGKLGTLQLFTESFAIPIIQGGYANASQTQVVTAHKCATILKDTITPYLLRRMKEDVSSHINLPSKKEQVLFCRLSDEQRQLYKDYLGKIDLDDMVRGKAKLFVALINLRKICNHPDLYSGGPNRNFHISYSDGPPTESQFGYWERAGKMIVIQTLLKIWNEQGHRVLLFTQSKKMLLVMEDFVRRSNYKYLKLDGQTSIGSRQPLIDKFNKDRSYFVMLLTTKVGGLGVNLTGANRVVIYDPDWNPATDTQARERAWRIGQQRDVTIYRLITAGTIEEKIYHRQIFKQFLSNKILKDPKQRRFFKSNDLLELFTLSETVRNGTTETAAIFAGTGSEIRKSDVKGKVIAPSENIAFSPTKIEQMKKLAQILSKKISGLNNNDCNKSEEGLRKEVESVAYIYGPDGRLDVDSVQGIIHAPSVTTSDNPAEPGILMQNTDPPTTSRQDQPLPPTNEESRENHSPSGLVGCSRRREDETNSTGAKPKKKKRYKECFAKFEGQEVPHLVKKRKLREESKSKENEKYISQDDYVLKKLFSKGIDTAMRHDVIMEGGPSDFAIVEAEAERVAQDAMKALKEAQLRLPRFSPLLPKRKNKGGEEDLLSVIRRRNMQLQASSTEKSLLSDMISWLQAQGGTATTQQLLDEFRAKVGEGKSPLFKALLEKIAKFYRGPDKLGYWTIRDEFNTPLPSTS